MNKSALASEAIRAALRLRADNQIGPAEALCPYDLARKLGIVVSLKSLPSLEGMYSPTPTLAIILGAGRPAGRRRYTCAHEIGHHIFNHGYSIDQLDESNSSPESPEEFLAQTFAGALLMPKLGLISSFKKRGWKIQEATAEQLFKISQEFGVGYTALITHMNITFEEFDYRKAEQLRKESVKEIRTKIAGFDITSDLFFIDQFWNRATIDVEVGDVIMFPAGSTVDGNGVECRNTPKDHYIASASGTYAVKLGIANKALQLRISRKNFNGLARHRHLEEVNDE